MNTHITTMILSVALVLQTIITFQLKSDVKKLKTVNELQTIAIAELSKNNNTTNSTIAIILDIIEKKVVKK